MTNDFLTNFVFVVNSTVPVDSVYNPANWERHLYYFKEGFAVGCYLGAGLAVYYIVKKILSAPSWPGTSE